MGIYFAEEGETVVQEILGDIWEGQFGGKTCCFSGIGMGEGFEIAINMGRAVESSGSDAV